MITLFTAVGVSFYTHLKSIPDRQANSITYRFGASQIQPALVQGSREKQGKGIAGFCLF